MSEPDAAAWAAAGIATGLMVRTRAARPGRPGAEGAPAVDLHCATCGDAAKPLLLMLHGFPECWFAWDGLMPHFADRFHVVAPDLRGFNLSSKPQGIDAYRASESVQDLVALIAALGHTSATVIAHDWGGAVGWGLAIGRPALVDRLVILNSPHPVPFARALAGDPAQQAASQYMNWLRAPGSEAVLAGNDFERMDRLFTGFGAAHWFDAAVRRRYHRAWAQPGALQAMVNWYRATPLHPPTADDPGAGRVVLDPARLRVTVPTRVLWAMADPALLPVLLDGLEDLGDDLRIRRLPGLTHWLVHEAPGPVTQAIEECLLG